MQVRRVLMYFPIDHDAAPKQVADGGTPPHVTLLYAEGDGVVGDVEAFLDAAEGTVDAQPKTLRLTGAVEDFGEGATACKAATINPETIGQLRASLMARLCEYGCACPQRWPEFRPHMTLTDGVEQVDEGDLAIGPLVVRLDLDDGERITFDFDEADDGELTVEQRTPTEAMARDAAAALEQRAKLPPSKRGMTPVGLARARDIAARRPLSPRTIWRMASFCARHEGDRRDEAAWAAWSKGRQGWYGWGCQSGKQWIAGNVARLSAGDVVEKVDGRLAEMTDDDGVDRFAEVTAGASAIGVGRPFVMLSVGPIYSRTTGKQIGDITEALLDELARVFAERSAHDNVPIDWNHGSAQPDVDEQKPGPDAGGALGSVVRVWRDGPHLWCEPRWNRRGAHIIEGHQAGDTSDLFPSPEFIVKRDGLTCRRSGEVYGWAQLLAVATTTRPAQTTSAVTPILLSEEHDPSAVGAEENQDMDLKKIAALLRAKGATEDEIAEVIGTAEVEAGEKPADDKPEMAEGGEKDEAMLADVEQKLSEAQAERQQYAEQLAEVRAGYKQLLAERERERAQAIEDSITAEYKSALAEGRVHPGDAKKKAFHEVTRNAELAKATARKADPAITDEALEQLDEVQTWRALFGEVQPDLADALKVHGHAERPAVAPDAEDPSEVLVAEVKKFAEDNKIGGSFAAKQRAYKDAKPQRYRELMRARSTQL